MALKWATEEEVNPLLEQALVAEDDVQSQVLALLGTLQPNVQLLERRHDARYPFPRLLELTPVGADGISPCGESVVVVGKHLSPRGLGFYHQQPLPYRRMIVSLESGNGHYFAFLIDLNWCRFTKKGWYESGGRFLQAVPSPVERQR
jgi:hypothetical protein